MTFAFRNWNKFCKKIVKSGSNTMTAKDAAICKRPFLVLKHDVETNVKKAYKMSLIETNNGIKGSYYVQAYLLNKEKNIKLLKQMQKAGHEISYHYDVMDENHGDYDKALVTFEKNINLFRNNGFEISTVCQHGNPLISRNGYSSNRDFFRNEKTKQIYCDISDIMVNYMSKFNLSYDYYSDAGRKFKLIYDPINNDLVKSDDKNIPFKNLNELFIRIEKNNSAIISTHPHRWCNSAIIYHLNNLFFQLIRFVAKILYKIPFMKKIINKHYYLAKKM